MTVVVNVALEDLSVIVEIVVNEVIALSEANAVIVEIVVNAVIALSEVNAVIALSEANAAKRFARAAETATEPIKAANAIVIEVDVTVKDLKEAANVVVTKKVLRADLTNLIVFVMCWLLNFKLGLMKKPRL